MEPIVEISKSSIHYPQSLQEMDELSPDTIYAQGNMELLQQPVAAFICASEVTEDNAIKVAKMSSEIDGKYRWMFKMDDSISEFALLRCRDAVSKPIVILKELGDDYTEEYGNTISAMLEDIVEDGGLLLSFGYDDEAKRNNSQLPYDIMIVVAEVVAVPLCSKKDYAVRRTIDFANQLGKKVLINKEELINLQK